MIIYDLLGRELATLVNEQLKAGVYEADWDAGNFASGVYFYSLITDDFAETKKMVLIK
jgi:predicted nucleotidyltransferase